MSETISSRQLSELEQMIKDYIAELDTIDKAIESSAQDITDLSALSVETQKKILIERDKALSVGYASVLSISNLIQKFRAAPASLLRIFIRLVSRFVALITKYVGLFKIDSIEITISLTPSVVVTLKP